MLNYLYFHWCYVGMGAGMNFQNPNSWDQQLQTCTFLSALCNGAPYVGGSVVLNPVTGKTCFPPTSAFLVLLSCPRFLYFTPFCRASPIRLSALRSRLFRKLLPDRAAKFTPGALHAIGQVRRCRLLREKPANELLSGGNWGQKSGGVQNESHFG
jgi:hypothetical protein